MSQTQTLKENNEALPTSSEDLFACFEKLGIKTKTYDHKPVFTVEEGLEIEKNIPGAHCRNLFVRDNKKKMFLIVLRNETKVDMKKLAPVIGSGRLSFGSADRLWETLGIRPGSVCPFTIINDKEQKVTLVLEAGMMEEPLVNYHPLDNAKTTGLSPDDLLKFIDFCGHTPQIIDLGPAAP